MSLTAIHIDVSMSVTVPALAVLREQAQRPQRIKAQLRITFAAHITDIQEELRRTFMAMLPGTAPRRALA